MQIPVEKVVPRQQQHASQKVKGSNRIASKEFFSCPGPVPIKYFQLRFTLDFAAPNILTYNSLTKILAYQIPALILRWSILK